jgi:thiol-disulfide isomerase/thioredoxin
MRYAKLFTIVLFIALATFACGKQKETPEKNQEMTPADYVEQASFTDFEGNTVHLSDFKGKVVLIDFWETWCRPCLASFPTMQKLMNDYPEDFVVLAVTPGFTDTKADAQEFISNHDYDFVYLLDENKLHQKLQVQSIPYKVFVDAQGNYIESSIGSYGPEEDYKKAKALIEEYKSADVASGS